mgnify:CR=1 FL=1
MKRISSSEEFTQLLDRCDRVLVEMPNYCWIEVTPQAALHWFNTTSICTSPVYVCFNPQSDTLWLAVGKEDLVYTGWEAYEVGGNL